MLAIYSWQQEHSLILAENHVMSHVQIPAGFCIILMCTLNACVTSTQLEEQKTRYSEQHRPQFHFSPETGWMNDPNGLVYHDGEYHLFYQFYPDSTVWGPMHWGHAVSPDLVHWQHLPTALFPDTLGYIFSGSAVADVHNTSGFGIDGVIPLVAIFTHHDPEKAKAGLIDVETQSIAYSLDKGRSWTKYAGNPVVSNPGIRNFRDPKVFWHAESAHWIMPVAAHDHLVFYRSPDLRSWEHTGTFGSAHGAHGGVWECPDLFPLSTNKDAEKWVLIQNMDRGAVNGGSGAQYFIGHFDGTTFINNHPPEQILWLDYGADNYAGVTWFNAPDNRRIFIGWMSQWFDYAQTVPTDPWRSAMTIPRDLSLVETHEGYRLAQLPAKELKQLRLDTTVIESLTFRDNHPISEGHRLIELQLEFDVAGSTATEFGFILKNTLGEQVVVGYNNTDQIFFIDRTNSGKIDFSERFARRDVAPYSARDLLKMIAIVDVASVEVFVDDGILAMTEIFFPNEDFHIVELYSVKASTKLASGSIHRLKSIWRE